MKTLIFKTVGKQSSNSTKQEFVKEGNFLDAMSHFDDSYPTFFYELGDEGYNEDVANGANWYYSDSAGNLIVRDLDLINNYEWSNNIDNAFFRDYHTSKIDNLSDDELRAVLEADYDWLTEEVLVAMGFDYTAYQVAKYFGDVSNYLEMPCPDFLERFYTAHEEEQEEDYIEIDGKFYTQD